MENQDKNVPQELKQLIGNLEKRIETLAIPPVVAHTYRQASLPPPPILTMDGDFHYWKSLFRSFMEVQALVPATD
jgi:hypothetical protein